MPDKKITELDPIDAVVGTDLLVVVDDPAGTPVTKQATIAQVPVTVLGGYPGGVTAFLRADGTFAEPVDLGVATLYPANAVPTTGTVVDAEPIGDGINLGFRFRVDVAGFVRGIRFYKGDAGPYGGDYSGALWSQTGTLLASRVLLPNPGVAIGWQTILFTTPVAVVPGTTYVASYNAPEGHYTKNESWYTDANIAAYQRAPIHGLPDDWDGDNGVYAYGAQAFPTSTYNSSNYWVDVLFVEPDTLSAHAPSHEPGGSDELTTAAWTDVANTFLEPQTFTGDAAVTLRGPAGDAATSGSLELRSGTDVALGTLERLSTVGVLLLDAVSNAQVALGGSALPGSIRLNPWAPGDVVVYRHDDQVAMKVAGATGQVTAPYGVDTPTAKLVGPAGESLISGTLEFRNAAGDLLGSAKAVVPYGGVDIKSGARLMLEGGTRNRLILHGAGSHPEVRLEADASNIRIQTGVGNVLSAANGTIAGGWNGWTFTEGVDPYDYICNITGYGAGLDIRVANGITEFSVKNNASSTPIAANFGVVSTPGVKFPSTQVPSTDANTDDDYREGAWTVSDTSGQALTITNVVGGNYVKKAQLVLGFFYVTFPVTANATAVTLGGFPFTPYGGTGVGVVGHCTKAAPLTIHVSGANIYLKDVNGNALTYANMTGHTLIATLLFRASA